MAVNALSCDSHTECIVYTWRQYTKELGGSEIQRRIIMSTSKSELEGRGQIEFYVAVLLISQSPGQRRIWFRTTTYH